jgi:glutamine cyclotransferase
MPFARPSLRWIIPLMLIFAAALAGTACAPHSAPNPSTSEPVYSHYTVVNTFPHDRGAFTEGLVFWHGHLYESTGLNGHSDLREVDLTTGNVLRQVSLASEFFGEGLALLGDKAYQLTWQNHTAFRYNLADFKLEKTFSYDGEGWGLTTDGTSLIMSDGTSQIRFLDPATFTVQRTINVLLNGVPVKELNELEYIQGEIFANIWQTNYIVRIDPQTGLVLGVIDCTGLLSPADRAPDTDVLNGIAYDAEHDRIFVTGKKWPKIFEIKLTPQTSGDSGRAAK